MMMTKVVGFWAAVQFNQQLKIYIEVNIYFVLIGKHVIKLIKINEMSMGMHAHTHAHNGII